MCNAVFMVILSTATTSGLPAEGTTWEEARRARLGELEAHLDTESGAYAWFAEASHGERAGVPFVLLRLLPELAPDIWGGPEERFRRFGFFDDPHDAARPLPLGLGWVRDPVNGDDAGREIHTVTLTCAACHVGRVRTEPEGFQILVGAPNTEIDVRGYRHAFELTVDRLLTGPELDRTVDRVGERIRAACREGEPDRYFGGRYGIGPDHEARELAEYLNPDRCREILAGFAGRVRIGRAAVEKQLATSYSRPDAPPLSGGPPGQSDGSGDLIPKLLLAREFARGLPAGDQPEVIVERFLAGTYPEMPLRLATATDNLSVWRQADRTLGQLDGSIKAPMIRNIAAQVAVVGSPREINAESADISVRFTHELPAPPYPFAVDLTRARRGEGLFQRHCASCHRPHNTDLYGEAEIGMDMNRARVLTNAEGRDLLIGSFLTAIPEDYVATAPDGTEYRPRALPVDEVLNDRTRPDRQGYIAGPLDGIWARAPYLHNGSVPTLRHLLAPRNPESHRPEVFVRGSIEYDTAGIGFAWDPRDAGRLIAGAGPAALFDTRWDGASNRGHDRDVVVEGRALRLDWSGPEHREELEDLLEYLKTL